MKDYTGEPFVQMPVPMSMFAAVCAVLGGASVGAIAAAEAPKPKPGNVAAPQATGNSSATEETLAPAAPASAGTGATATTDASPSEDGELDADGWPWSADMHASTKNKTKDGKWRMKIGVSRPDPKPGFPKTDAAASTGTESGGTASEAGASATGDAAAANQAGPASPAAGEDEDEFAAFRAAADKIGATDNAAAAAAPARKWTDADLGALCNQAAMKLGNPDPVKALIAEYVPAGVVPHSRNIPDESRETFAQAVEAKAGITFAG